MLIFIILSCVFILTCKANCPPCPRSRLGCHLIVQIPGTCPCSACFAICSTRNSGCPRGEICTMEDVYYEGRLVGETAICKPFRACPQIHCPVGCPESSYFIDVNGCGTCLCNDPCKELKCPGSCSVSSSSPGTEPNYRCG